MGSGYFMMICIHDSSGSQVNIIGIDKLVVFPSHGRPHYESSGNLKVQWYEQVLVFGGIRLRLLFCMPVFLRTRREVMFSTLAPCPWSGVTFWGGDVWGWVWVWDN